MAEKIPGEFVPLDVNYSHDRAIRQAGYQAELLFVRGLCYARRMYKVTDGLIPDYDLPIVAAGLPNVKRSVTALVRERLWIAVKGGWRIRSFEKWNPNIDRAAQSTGGALGNHNRWHTEGRWSPDCAFCGGPPSDAEPVTDRSPTDHTPTTERVAPPIASASLSIAEVEREGEGERESESRPSSSSLAYVPRETATRMMPRAAS